MDLVFQGMVSRDGVIEIVIDVIDSELEINIGLFQMLVVEAVEYIEAVVTRLEPLHHRPL